MRFSLRTFLLGVAAFALVLTPAIHWYRDYRIVNSPVPWQTFSHGKALAMAASGTPVVVCVTADWMDTTVMYKRLTFQADKVKRFLRAQQIVPMLWDVSEMSRAESDLFHSLGAVSVPVVLWYPPGAVTPTVMGDEDALSPDQLIHELSQPR